MGKAAQVIIQRLLLDRSGMATAISVSEDTLDALRKLGCPSISLPGSTKVLFDPVDVVTWIKAQSVTGETLTQKAAKVKADNLFGN